jgi:hypothetical protein
MRNNAIGPARFSVVCGIDIDHARVGEASFRVLASNGQSSGGNGHSANRNDSQFPSRVDIGLGGTADGTSQDGLNPMLVLPAAGLLLIVVAVGIWLRQTTTRRRL